MLEVFQYCIKSTVSRDNPVTLVETTLHSTQRVVKDGCYRRSRAHRHRYKTKEKFETF